MDQSNKIKFIEFYIQEELELAKRNPYLKKRFTESFIHKPKIIIESIHYTLKHRINLAKILNKIGNDFTVNNDNEDALVQEIFNALQNEFLGT